MKSLARHALSHALSDREMAECQVRTSAARSLKTAESRQQLADDVDWLIAYVRELEAENQGLANIPSGAAERERKAQCEPTLKERVAMGGEP